MDGGNGSLEDAPNYMISINRVYYSLFQGRRRIKPRGVPRIQFFSYVTLNISAAKEAQQISYDTKFFAHAPSDRSLLPSESDLSSDIEHSSVLQGVQFHSMGRRFAEWQMAAHVVESELGPGDILVMDGSLETRFKNETKYAQRLYDLALQKGVTVCGLAKTSRLITESGDPLLARVSEIAEGVSYDSWYVRVSEKISSHDKGFMLVVRLHPKSRYVFRFEILAEQFARMSPDDLNVVLGSLAENSRDVAMLGYPYGAIDADRFAQVRTNELGMYRMFIRSEMLKNPEWRRRQKHSTGLGAHDTLNGVTS